MRYFQIFFLLFASVAPLAAAAKPHVVSFGAPTQVKLYVGPSEDKIVDITVLALYVDTKLKEYTTGPRHDVTDRVFVVRRAFRINDALPDDPKKHPRWLWQRGGWLLVDRSSGKVSSIKLPDFDPFYSEVSWYRDYAAYCGVVDNGEKLNAMVSQIGDRKPLYRKTIGKTNSGELTDSTCTAPHWERQPPRVTFQPNGSEKLSVTVTGRFAGIAPDLSADED
jgi:hypothetical protein